MMARRPVLPGLADTSSGCELSAVGLPADVVLKTNPNAASERPNKQPEPNAKHREREGNYLLKQTQF